MSDVVHCPDSSVVSLHVSARHLLPLEASIRPETCCVRAGDLVDGELILIVDYEW